MIKSRKCWLVNPFQLWLEGSGRHENSASWFLRQPYFEAKGNLISSVFFFDGSSGVPAVPATILMSDTKEYNRKELFTKI